jgi:serine/threonine-protein kinase ATR
MQNQPNNGKYNMAPVSRQAIASGHSNGYSNDGAMDLDAPPSTMAAQLISNFPSKNQTVTGEDVLEKLAEEVSGMELIIAETNNASEKLEYQHKLIYLFSRTILEKLNGKASVDASVFLSHASTAIDLIMTAVKDCPPVLDFTLPPGSYFEGRGQEPLWIWLFPRMLTMLGRKELGCLADKIKDFFFISFQVVSRSPRLWNLNFFFFTYLKECVGSMLSLLTCRSHGIDILIDILHQLEQPKTLTSTKVEIILPASQNDNPKFFSDSIGISSSQVPYCTYSITDSSEAFGQATQSLLMLVDICMEAASSFDATPAFEDYVAWIFESFCTLHNIYQKWRANDSLYKDCLDPDKLSFCSLYDLMLGLKDLLTPSLLRKGFTILSILCANILKEHDPSTQVAIRRCFLNLASTCQRYDSVRRLVSLDLLPVVKSALEDKSVPEFSDEDFQVSPFCPLLRYSYSLVHRKALSSYVIFATTREWKLHKSLQP